MSDQSEARKLIKSVDAARNFPTNTCPASRHVQMIGEYMVKGQPFAAMDEEPKHCGESLLVTAGALYKARSRIEADEALMKAALSALEESIDIVGEDYRTDWRHGLPTRKAQLDGKKEQLDAHESAITALRTRLETPK